MNKWNDVTDTFSEESRHYKETYLEICEVMGEELEISLFSSKIDSYEIYFSFGKMYGIVYADEEDAYEIHKQMKVDLENEYQKNKEPSSKFINDFAEKYKVCIPNDIFFDEDALMGALLKI